MYEQSYREFESHRLRHRGIAQPGSALVWGTSGRRFKSGYPDQLEETIMKPDVHNYTSDRVFDGVRILTQKQREEHLERLKRALEKRNNGK